MPTTSTAAAAATLLFWTAWGLIAYTYVAFPVLLSLCVRLLARRPAGEQAATAAAGAGGATADAAPLPAVAMVVAAYNEAAVLPSKLANTWAIDYPRDRFQLVIGSDGSTDGTAEALRRCDDPRLRAYAFPDRRGKISVLNDLVSRTDADILVMSDANTLFAPDAVRALVRHFADERVGCVSGELRLEQNGGVSGEGLYWKYEGWIKRCESRLGFLIGCNGGIYALRRALYEPLPASTVIEDFVLPLRVLLRRRGHYRIRFEPAARATEPPCASARAEMVRKVRIGAGGFQALRLTGGLLHPRHGLRAWAYWSHKVLRWLVPLFLLAAAAANAVLAVESEHAGAYRALLALQLGGGLVAGWAYNAGASPDVRRRPPAWTRPISYFYLMNYALFCGLLRFLFGTQRVTWDRVGR